MKNILTGIIILIFMSSHASGQQVQDTLYLKNGYNSVGKFLGESKKECRFKTSEGIYFSFSPDEVEKIVIAPKMIMGKVNPDTLNVGQLNIYKDKAVRMRNAGMIVTLSGIGVAATGIILGILSFPEQNPDEPVMAMGSYYIIGISGMIGIASTLVGVPLWAVGGIRKAKAELSLQKFNVVPGNSMVLGLGITIGF